MGCFWLFFYPLLENAGRPSRAKAQKQVTALSALEDINSDLSASANQQKIMDWFSTPIAVYARVVDENGYPVPGATFEIGIADNPMRTGSRLTRRSDENGFVSLNRVHGIAFSLRASKDGYYTTEQSAAHRNVAVPASGDAPPSSPGIPIPLILHKRGDEVRLSL